MHLGNSPLNLSGLWLQELKFALPVGFVLDDCFVQIDTLECKNLSQLSYFREQLKTDNVFLRKITLKLKYGPWRHISKEKMSWISASDTCRIIGGFLPSLASREKLHYFVALVKSIEFLTIPEGIFIGLSFNGSKEVVPVLSC